MMIIGTKASDAETQYRAKISKSDSLTVFEEDIPSPTDCKQQVLAYLIVLFCFHSSGTSKGEVETLIEDKLSMQSLAVVLIGTLL